VEKIESVLKQCSCVDQLWVYGNSLESCLVAVVVPQEPALKDWAQENSVAGTFQVRIRQLDCVGASWDEHLGKTVRVAELCS
jgi:long-chain acyl-CoA synthetase